MRSLNEIMKVTKEDRRFANSNVFIPKGLNNKRRRASKRNRTIAIEIKIIRDKTDFSKFERVTVEEVKSLWK